MEPVQRMGTEMRTSHRAEFAHLQLGSVVESFFFFSPVPPFSVTLWILLMFCE